MGELVTKYGDRTDGELIRADDWNGMLDMIEKLFDDMRSEFGERLDKVEAQADALETRADTAEQRLDDAETVLDQLSGRFRRLDLSTTSSNFTIGQRGTITAQVTAIDGSPLDLSNAATRPWVDFVTVWGTLKAAPGFTSRGGAGDQTLSVRVNAEGIAQVLIRAEHAESFTEEEEQEIEGFLETRPVADMAMTMGEVILGANTPRDGAMDAVYKKVSAEYGRKNNSSKVFQHYVDAYYVHKPSQAASQFGPIYSQRWRDYRATVMAFLKPDSDPTSADGALASASIQVTFRDWISPWIIVDYLPGVAILQVDYADRFRNLIGVQLADSLDLIIDEVDDIVRDKGLIGRQRDLLAINEAIGGIRFDTDPPLFMADLVQAVQFGSQVQHAMFYSQAVTPGDPGGAKGFGAVAGSAGRATAEAGKVREELNNSVDQKLAQASDSLRQEVQVAQVAFQEELLREDGPVLSVQREVAVFAGQVQNLQTEVGKKANSELISAIIGTLPQ